MAMLKRIARRLGAVLAFLLALPIAWADDQKIPDLRRVTITEAAAEPLWFHRNEPLQRLRNEADGLQLAIVFSRPKPQPSNGGGLGSLLAPRTDAVLTWMQDAERSLRELGASKYHELGGNPSAAPEFRATAYNTPGIDHRSALVAAGFTGRARMRQVVDGEHLWAALYSRQDRAPAALGTVTATVRVRFAPTVNAAGAILLNPQPEVSLAPSTAPEGVVTAEWQQAREQRMDALRQEVRAALVSSMEQRAIELPEAAARAFAKGEPYRLALRAPLFWNERRLFTLTVSGTATPVVDEILGGADQVWPTATNGDAEAPLAEAVAGPWTVLLDDPDYGILGGFANFAADGTLSLAIDYPSRTRAEQACRYRVRRGIDVQVTCRQWLDAELEVHPERTRMRGRWYDNTSGHADARSGRERGMTRWRRMAPKVDAVRVQGLPDGALDHALMIRNWAKYLNSDSPGDLPYAMLEFEGSELPRSGWGGDESARQEYTGVAIGIDSLEFNDPKLLFHEVKSRADGRGLQVFFHLEPDALPGRKLLLLNHTPIEFDLDFSGYAGSEKGATAFDFVLADQPDGRALTYVARGDRVELIARFAEAAGADLLHADLLLGRFQGEPGHGAAIGAVDLVRDREHPQTYRSSPLMVDQPLFGSRVLLPGDRLIARLDQRMAEVTVGSRSLFRPAPRVLFVRQDADGGFSPIADFDGVRPASDGRYPVRLRHGERFHVEAHYRRTAAPSDTVVDLELGWDGGSRHIALVRVDDPWGGQMPAGDAMVVYRSGPIVVGPMDDATSIEGR